MTVYFHDGADMTFAPLQVSNMLNKLHGQPDSYDKKYAHRIFLQNYANQAADQDIDLVEHSARVLMEL
jgi:hypothetical protein